MNHLLRAALGAMLLAASALSIVGCERDITVDIPKEERKMVVHGHIENGEYAYVSLTWNNGIFTPLVIDSNDLSSFVITAAKVTLSDGVNSEVLLPSFYYQNYTPYTYVGRIIKGEVGKTYTLTIEYDGYKLKATTFMPPVPPAPDSLWVLPDVAPESARDSMLRTLYYRYDDPDTPGNRLRIFTIRNGAQQWTSGFRSVYDDKLTNGGSIIFPLPHGKEEYTTNDSLTWDEFAYFVIGDTVHIKWCAMDNAHYEFWRTLEYARQTAGNPFASPTVISSNVFPLEGSKGGAIGVWGAYSVVPIPPYYVK